MQDPMLSIIIPTLNEEIVIKRTITALRVMSSISYEIIISDGHSIDKTVEIAKKYADKVVEHDGKTRQNISQGRNAGAAAAKGEILVFLDADSRIENPDIFFAEALKQFNINSKLVGFTVKVKVFPDNATLADNIIFGILNMMLILRNNFLHIGASTGEFQMIRKTAFDFLNGFREDLIAGEDFDMFFRLSKVGRTMLCPKLTIFHSGRRAHKIGWPKLLWLWTVNNIWVLLFNHAASKEWKAIR